MVSAYKFLFFYFMQIYKAQRRLFFGDPFLMSLVAVSCIESVMLCGLQIWLLDYMSMLSAFSASPTPNLLKYGWSLALCLALNFALFYSQDTANDINDMFLKKSQETRLVGYALSTAVVAAALFVFVFAVNRLHA